jgi:hypothetical protein
MPSIVRSPHIGFDRSGDQSARLPVDETPAHGQIKRPRSNKAIKRPKLRTSPWKPKATQLIAGMDAVDKIKTGAKQDNGAVTAPNKIVKMQLASGAAPARNKPGPQGPARTGR